MAILLAGLIWTVILSRAFGPGPMTGAIAIAITDAGSFGKTFSEALENIDEKQVEGIQSTGANSLQRAQRDTRDMQAAMLRAELDALKAQINPHFLFNALNAVTALIGADRKAVVIRLSECFRATLALAPGDLVAHLHQRRLHHRTQRQGQPRRQLCQRRQGE